MRRVVVAAVALLVALQAPAARADVTFGPDLTVAPTAALGVGGSLTAAADMATAPFAGVITLWRVRVGSNPGPVRFRVLRPSTGFEFARSDVVSDLVANTTREFEVRIPVAQGDQIALDCCAAAVSPQLFIVGGGGTSIYEPPIGEGGAIPIPFLRIGDAPAINADLEPDRDGDAYGDESQDNCGGTANPDQQDTDSDGLGDACDPDADRDGDGVANAADVCPVVPGAPPNGCPAPPAAPRVNTPPVVRFRTPASGTAVRATQAIELDVADDAGNPTVTVFDDDGQVCALTAPPYTCTWRPTGADVGRATLLASAVDSDNRSTLGIVRVNVARFSADLTSRARGRRVSGRLVLPAAVERALGCRGEVTVRRGRVTRTVALKRNCTYSARLTRRGRVRARFAGNAVVEPAT